MPFHSYIFERLLFMNNFRDRYTCTDSLNSIENNGKNGRRTFTNNHFGSNVYEIFRIIKNANKKNLKRDTVICFIW